jgi:hypothetical protein
VHHADVVRAKVRTALASGCETAVPRSSKGHRLFIVSNGYDNVRASAMTVYTGTSGEAIPRPNSCLHANGEGHSPP